MILHQFSSSDSLGLHQPRSITWGGRTATPAPSGRAAYDYAIGPAVTRFNYGCPFCGKGDWNCDCPNTRPKGFRDFPDHGPVWTQGRVAGTRGRKPERFSSGERTDEALARECRPTVGVAALDVRTRSYHGGAMQAGMGSERSSLTRSPSRFRVSGNPKTEIPTADQDDTRQSAHVSDTLIPNSACRLSRSWGAI